MVSQRPTGGSSSYYELPPDCKTLQDIIVKKGMDLTRGKIFKAADRWDRKPDLEYNLNKIKWFCEDAPERLYTEGQNNPPQKIVVIEMPRYCAVAKTTSAQSGIAAV